MYTVAVRRDFMAQHHLVGGDYNVTGVSFPGTPGVLGTQMQSVGEVMAIGRTFKEALQKGLRGLETGTSGFARTPGRPAMNISGNSSTLTNAGYGTTGGPALQLATKHTVTKTQNPRSCLDVILTTPPER